MHVRRLLSLVGLAAVPPLNAPRQAPNDLTAYAASPNGARQYPTAEVRR